MDPKLSTSPLSRGEKETETEAARLIEHIEEALAAVALRSKSDIESLEATADRIERAARDLSQQRLDAESSRFEVCMSTNYQVVQAQRDLRDAQNSELRALLNYAKSLVEFDRVQQAGAR